MKQIPEFPLRTRFARDIVCEFLPPARASKNVLILATGMPGYPGGRGKMMRTLAERGYWVFVPRYRGCWESGGRFLEKSPHEDILAVAKGITKPFIDYYTDKTFQIKNPKIFIVGASFGGAAALLASSSPLITKVVALSPVVDWQAQSKTIEPLSYMETFIPKAFGDAYRGHVRAVIRKLASGTFYNPVHQAHRIDGSKVFIVHAKDDKVVPFTPAHIFANKIGANFLSLAKGGHLGTSSALKPRLWRRIQVFFTEK